MASSARIDELLKKFDENPRRYFAPLANEYRKAGDLEQAIFICQEYLPQQPGHMSGHIVYGQALFELNRHDEARAVFETALTLDPENLIALRHLGDIARLAGDTASARTWYQRVLEADPRNEEIAQLMLSLLSPEQEEAAPATAAPTPAADRTAVDHTAPTPLATPVVPTPTETLADESFEVEKATDTVLAEQPAEPPVAAAPPAPEPPAERPFASKHAPKDEELLDLDAFDLGGVPLSSLRGAKEASPAGVAEDSLDIETTSASVELPSLSASDESPEEPAVPELADATPETPSNEELEAAFEADPFAIAASAPTAPSAPAPEIELAADVSLGLPDDGSSPSLADGGEVLEGLESFEAGIIANKPADTMSIEMGSFYEAAELTSETAAVPSPAAEMPADMSIETPVETPADEAGETPAEAFVTETMATLYLQQGHLDSALDIYRKLVEAKPDDAGLRERMQTVEAHLAAQNAAVEPAVETPAPASRSYGGPTIREFLSGLMNRRPGVVETPVAIPTEIEMSPEMSREMSPEMVAFHSAETPLSNPRVEEVPTSDAHASMVEAERPVSRPVVDARPTPSTSETVSGSLGVLFSGAAAAESDTEAAQTLADAFAPTGPETAPLEGMPAHRASSELSLNHVFKGSSSPRTSQETEDFSFDEFFTESAAAGNTPVADTPVSNPVDGADDIAQFNAWLNGLKKT